MPEKKIVVVDDVPSMIRILLLTFVQLGYQTLKAMDGFEGVQVIREEEPDLVVVDVMMPGKDGYALCQEIRADTSLSRQPYIIMLTARGMASERKRAQASGADEFMTKPFSPSQLAQHVRQILEMR